MDLIHIHHSAWTAVTQSTPAADWGTVPDWIVGFALLTVSIFSVKVSHDQYRLGFAPRLDLFLLGVYKIREGDDFPVKADCLHWEVLLVNPGQATMLIESFGSSIRSPTGQVDLDEKIWTGRSHPEVMQAPRYLGIFPWELAGSEGSTVARSETVAIPIDELPKAFTLEIEVVYRSGSRRRKAKVNESVDIDALSTLDREVEPLAYDERRRVFDREDRTPRGAGRAPLATGTIGRLTWNGAGFIRSDDNETLWVDASQFTGDDFKEGDRVQFRIIPGEPNRRAAGVEHLNPVAPIP